MKNTWLLFTKVGECDGKGWLDDPQLTVRCGPLTECGDITVSSNGPTANKKSECLGVYKRTHIISCGRFVFKHQDRERYLSIPPGNTSWMITDKPGDTAGDIQSAAAANCPASYRNRYNERLNQKSWMYGNNGRWHEDPTITVTCSNHSPHYYWLGLYLQFICGIETCVSIYELIKLILLPWHCSFIYHW